MISRLAPTLLLSLLTVQLAFGQVVLGTPAFGSYGGGPFDTVDNGNLNVNFLVPILSRAGRGMPFSYALNYDSSVWTPVGSGSTKVWTPAANWGWVTQTNVLTGSETFTTGITQCSGEGHTMEFYTYTHYLVYTQAPPLGTTHPLAASVNGAQPLCGITASTYPITVNANDGSGYYMTLTCENCVTVYGPSGIAIRPALVLSGQQSGANGSGSITDNNGNLISTDGTHFYDTLSSTTPVLTVSGTSPVTYQYTNPTGGTSSITLNYTPLNIKTAFGCSGITEYTSTSAIPFPTSLELPDGTAYTFTYEQTPGPSGFYTGRIASIQLPTGGTISYQYNGPNDGIMCGDGSGSGFIRTTPDGTWTYARTGTAPNMTTTIISSDSQTVSNFYQIYETNRVISQGSNVLRTVQTCYPTVQSLCPTNPSVTLPITERSVYNYLSGGLTSEQFVQYSATNGLPITIQNYDYGTNINPLQNSPPLLTTTSITYATLTATTSGSIVENVPSQITTSDGHSTFKTTYAYDEAGTLVSTSGITQHSAVTCQGSATNCRGNLTTITRTTQGSQTIAQHFTNNDTGTVASFTDFNSAQTPYTYGSGSCNGAFPTSAGLPVSGLTLLWTYNCNGGVMTSATDANGGTTSTIYNDPNLWRPTGTEDQANNVTTINYAHSPSSVERVLPVSGTTSAADALTTLDGLGRPVFGQVKQAPGSSTFDSVQATYARNTTGWITTSSVPYAGAAAAPAPGGTPATTTQYDPLGRPVTVTDGGGGTVSYSYTANDVLQTVGTTRKQLEYDGAGRLTSVCELSSTLPGYGTCGQTTSQPGFWTRYTYDAAGDLTGVTQNAQGTSQQTRTYAFDGLSRLTSETNPETGSKNYTYDTDSTCGTSNGDLVKRVDAAGYTTCYSYDLVHRLTSETYSGPNATPNKYFVYDAATVNNVVMANVKGRMAEAYTGSPSSKTTDVGFVYTIRGENAEIWESTQNSGGYYHPTAAFWPNFALHTLWMSGLPSVTYGVEGEGRTSAVSASSGQNPVTGVNYNESSTTEPIGALTQVSFGSGDSDNFNFDPNTGRMTQYQFNVNGKSEIGKLVWNANSTLATLGITDPFNSPDAQNCSYAYDDLARLQSVGCGSVWGQTFVSDAFGNTTKLGSSAWQPTYNTKNQYASLPSFTPTYDANGDLLTDSFHTYKWDADGHVTAIDSIGLAYDALGRMVEQNPSSGTYYQIVYTPMGSKLTIMKGQTIQQAFVPLPGGTTAEYLSWGLSYYRHPDWLGSERLESSTSHSILQDTAYAPFGEPYAELSGGNGDLSFTGQNKDTDWLNFDFMYREYDPRQGRWISPDPAGLAAVDPSDPQSWNRYAYVENNPLSFTDWLGLQHPGCFNTLFCNPAWQGWSDTGFAGSAFDFLGITLFSPDSIFQDGGCLGCGDGFLVGMWGGGTPSLAAAINPCAHAGTAKTPSQYAAAGQAFKNSYIDPADGNDGAGLVVGGLLNLYSNFQQGGPLDAQPYASGTLLQKATYGNYAFGTFFAAAGFSLQQTLSAANIYGYKQQIVNGAYQSRNFGPDYGGIPNENVQDITAGYNAQMNGTLCHN